MTCVCGYKCWCLYPHIECPACGRECDVPEFAWLDGHGKKRDA